MTIVNAATWFKTDVTNMLKNLALNQPKFQTPSVSQRLGLTQ